MIGTILNKRYRLDAELGRGGMGTVYRAHDTMLDRPVAVKLLGESGMGTEGRERMLREAQAIAKLNHPNIVQVHDAGQLDGTPFIVMELVEGSNLHDQPPKGFPAIVAVARHICAALEHAHSHGIVHRDLKPENVILVADGTAKLMDFGLARSVASRLTGDGQVAGTVFYLAPEIALGQAVDGRADLYSLGVMLYELTTGELPFGRGDSLAVISQHIHANPLPPRSRNAAIPPLFEQLTLHLLSKSPGDRPNSAASVSLMLEQPTLLDSEAETDRELAVLARIVRGRFVGRSKELKQAKKVWSEISAGQGQTIVISGEPGVGKSRLLRELITQVEVTGGLALTGEAYPGAAAPYAPFGQVLRGALERAVEVGVEVSEGNLADLLDLAPEMRPSYPDIAPNPSLSPEAEQHRQFESVVALLSAVAERTPALVAIEDAHWADSSSLALIRHLARRTRRQSLLIALTHREVEMSEAPGLYEVLIDLDRNRLATRVQLARFTRREVHDLLHAIFEEEITPEFLEGIYRETEGNAFFIEEVCKGLVESGKLYFKDGRWHRPSMDELEIPESVRVAIQSRIASMPEAYQEALRLAAVLGRNFDYDTLAKATELDEETLIQALEAAERAQLIEGVGNRGAVTFSFLHALIPATLAETVHILRRPKLHRQAAAAIEALRPEDLEALAYHYGEAGDKAKALNYYTRAGERALAAYANREAESHFRAALNLVQADAQRASLLAKLGIVQSHQARFEEAIETWKTAIGVFDSLDHHAQVAWCFARSARAAWEAGDFPRGLALANEGIAAVPAAAESPELADLLQEAARACFFNEMGDEGMLLSRRALEIAERHGVAKIQVESLITWAMFEKVPTEQVIPALERAIELARNENLPEQEARARNNLAGQLAIMHGEIDAARSHYRKAADLAHRTGQVARELSFRSVEALWAINQGDLSHAASEIARLKSLSSESMRSGEARIKFRRLEANLWRAQGQLEAAAGRYRELQGEALAGGMLEDVWEADWSLADILIETGKFEEAEAALLEAIELSEGEGSGGSPAWTLLHMSLLYSKRRDPDHARQMLSDAKANLAKRPARFEAPWVELAEGQIALAESRWEEACQHFGKHLELLAAMGLRLGHALAVREWASAHLTRGELEDTSRARELLGQARAEFAAMGAQAYVEKLNRQLEELG